MSQINYQKRAVAFIDVLGFKNLVDASVTDKSERIKLNSLVGLLESAIPTLNASVSSSVPQNLIPRHTYISDCIILSAPIHDASFDKYNGLNIVVMRTIQLTHHFLAAGYLLRGGISIGQVWHSDGNIIGPAYQEALRLEQEAHNPRVILSPAAVQNWKSGISADSRMCLHDGEVVMVNGLYDFYVADQSQGGVERTFACYKEVVEHMIPTILAPSAKAKWEWFQNFLKCESVEASRWSSAGHVNIDQIDDSK